MVYMRRIIFLLCLLIIISGCELIIQPWSIAKKDPVTEERQNIVETMIGASQDQVTEILGNPYLIYTDGTQKYLIYSSQSASDLFLTFFFVMPAIYDSNYDDSGTLNCIKIDLDSRDIVTSYEFDSSIEGQCIYCIENCLEAFWTSTEQNSLVRLYTGPSNKRRFGIHPHDAKWQGDKVTRTYCTNADLGHTDAQHYIADIYYEGALGHAVDTMRAWVWYSLAAQNGDVQAAGQLARVTTELTPEQFDEAKRQLALWKPGQCEQELLHGIPYYLNENKSAHLLLNDIDLFCSKADRGKADAQTYIGDLYYVGSYGLFDKDLIQAYVWYSLASNNGNSYATSQAEIVRIELTPEQLQKATDRLEKWEPGHCRMDLLMAASSNGE